MNFPDLTQRPPRSPRVRLGGYAMLARMLDKARATLAGKQGEYICGNPMDRHLFAFTGIGKDALLEQVKTGAGDWELLEWVNANTVPKRAPHEIRAWSIYLETMPTGNAEDLEWFAAQARRINSVRADPLSDVDFLDADDRISFATP